MRTTFSGPLAVPTEEDLVFGVAPQPVAAGRGLVIGEGMVYPEINFTLPAIPIEESTWPEIRHQYQDMISSLVKRAKALQIPGLVVEFEQLPAMTAEPWRGAEITGILRDTLEGAHDKFGLKSALRVTIVDMRDSTRPPQLRSGPHWEAMLESWRLCAQNGADLLSVESVGGKEVHDQALLNGDVAGIVYSLGVLAASDMEWLWGELVSAAVQEGSIAAGDSACGFANTAMQLAHQKMLPEVLAAVVRAMGAARSLIAMECGARGPSKDCAYEGPVLKMISGCPISMEGKSAACAHLSPVGNIAGMAADLWSNESVQNVRLLAAGAPEVFLEILAYDCRLFNQAASRGQSRLFRDLLVESDELRSPQALVLGPRATIRIAQSILEHGGDDYRRTLAAGRTAVGLIREALAEGKLNLAATEARWLDRIERALEKLPDDAERLEADVEPFYRELFDPRSYRAIAIRTP
jgi:methanol--5-hydroxybenzimidazolylcobamide Co-methyltransferase